MGKVMLLSLGRFGLGLFLILKGEIFSAQALMLAIRKLGFQGIKL